VFAFSLRRSSNIGTAVKAHYKTEKLWEDKKYITILAIFGDGGK
jgi:hypothetical protein